MDGCGKDVYDFDQDKRLSPGRRLRTVLRRMPVLSEKALPRLRRQREGDMVRRPSLLLGRETRHLRRMPGLFGRSAPLREVQSLDFSPYRLGVEFRPIPLHRAHPGDGPGRVCQGNGRGEPLYPAA